VGWFDLDSLPIMQKAQRDRLATARSVFDMGVPFNELNRVLDLGFRKLPWGDRGYVASNLAEVGEDAGAGKCISPNGSNTAAAKTDHHRGFEEGETLNRLCGLLEQLKPAPANVSSNQIPPEFRPHPDPLPQEREKASGLRTALSRDSVKRGEAVLPLPGGEGGPVLHLDQATPVPIHHLSSGDAGTTIDPHPVLDPQLVSRLRRFFFEQRGRVLENLAQASVLPHANGFVPVVLALAIEAKLIEAIKMPPSITADKALQFRERLRQKVNEVSGNITASLTDGIEQNQSREQLAERLRSIYNQIAVTIGKWEFNGEQTSTPATNNESSNNL
jgi:hypothetical protein